MTKAWILSGIILLYYCMKEARKAKPNWARAVNSTIFWPLSIISNFFVKDNDKK
ncbi:hypothetical protein SAMN04487995_0134 [Dyadobacter koreensis]|uniref:Uncharacterized protein n=1 Tax=Dyadobacter koreensis TaxID=408657 RepID=A0A1H6Q0T0_9BACT|nr:hypothetical protein SAMN04487995_0134 [Dyadobacter koreensis]